EKETARAGEEKQRKKAEEAARQKEIARLEAVDAKNRAEEEERQAKLQASIAQAVNDLLLVDLLGQADIANQPLMVDGVVRERDPNLTVRELLDRAAREIEGKFAKQELTEAAIRTTIGKAYYALGEFPDAQKHLERAVQLRTAAKGEGHPDTLTS